MANCASCNANIGSGGVVQENGRVLCGNCDTKAASEVSSHEELKALSESVHKVSAQAIKSGKIDYGDGSYAVTLRKDIAPFLFPCQSATCGQYCFHLVGEQATGLCVKIPFMKTPLASTGKGFHIICMTCTTINGRIERGDVIKLQSNIIPKGVFRAYPAIHGFYQPEFIKDCRQYFCPENPERAETAESWLRAYKLEV